jgi:general secretion pathway protein N
MAKPDARTGWSLSTFDDTLLMGLRRTAGAIPHLATPRVGRWAMAGGVVGALAGLIAFAPAAWLAGAVASATDGRLLLAEAEGSLWRGSALMVLTGGPGSRDATVLPSRLDWSLSPTFTGLKLQLAQGCCIEPGLALDWRPGFGRSTLRVLPGAADGGVGHWPAAWLEGLGAPWNTLRPGGQLRLASQGLVLESQAGAWRVQGKAELDWLQASSRLSTLDALGSYRVGLDGGSDTPALSLRTLEGALQLSGSGQWGPRGVKFKGDARAAPGFEPALNNLLNIIGRRNGAAAVISIG